MVLQASKNPAQWPCQAHTSQMQLRAMGLPSDLVSAPVHCTKTSSNPTPGCHNKKEAGTWVLSAASPNSDQHLSYPKVPQQIETHIADPSPCRGATIQYKHWNNSPGLQPGMSPGMSMQHIKYRAKLPIMSQGKTSFGLCQGNSHQPLNFCP